MKRMRKVEDALPALEANKAEATDKPAPEINLAVAALARHARERSRLALVWEAADGRRESYTFFDLDRLSNRIANALEKIGVESGDRVFTLLGRTPALYAVLPAILKLGATAGALFTEFGPEAIRQRLADAGARVVITDTANAPKLGSILASLPNLAHIIIVGELPLCAQGKKQIFRFDELVKNASAEFAPVAVNADDMCFFIYTSGTTGLPKGVVLPHAVGERLATTAEEVLGLRDDDFYWCTADPGWVTGLCYGIFAPWLLGLPIFSYEGEFESRKWIDLLERHQITCWYTTPTSLRLLMREGEDLVQGRDLALRRIYSVGEPLNPEVIAWAERVFDAPIYDSYWQTETGSQVIANRPGIIVRRGSMGKAVSGVHAAVIDERGREVADGTIGDIAIPRRCPRCSKVTGTLRTRRARAFAPGGTSHATERGATKTVTSGLSDAMMTLSPVRRSASDLLKLKVRCSRTRRWRNRQSSAHPTR